MPIRPAVLTTTLLILLIPATAGAERHPLDIASDAIDLEQCQRALDALAGYKPAAGEEYEYTRLTVFARWCVFDEEAIAEAIEIAKAYLPKAPTEYKAMVEQWLSVLESSEWELVENGDAIAADREVLDEAEELLAKRQCRKVQDEILPRTSSEETSSRRYRWVTAQTKRCLVAHAGGRPELLREAADLLEGLARELPGNLTVFSAWRDTEDEIAATAKREGAKESRGPATTSQVDLLEPAGSLNKLHVQMYSEVKQDLEAGRCKAAKERMIGLGEAARSTRTHRLWTARVARCWGVDVGHEEAEEILVDLIALQGDDARLRTELEDVRGELAQMRAAAAAPAVAAAPTPVAPAGAPAPAAAPADTRRPKLELTPMALSLGFGAERVVYRADLPEPGRWALHLTASGGYLDVALGAIGGDDGWGFDGRAGLRLLAWPAPHRSKFSIVGTAGLAVRPPLPIEITDEPLAVRGYLTAKIRVTCGVLVNASYQPALQDTMIDTMSIGLELQLKYVDEDFSSVCRR